MRKIIIAAMTRDGVIGRTKKRCETCGGDGLEGLGGQDIDGFEYARYCRACGGLPSNPNTGDPGKPGAGFVPANDLPWGRAYPEDLARFKTITMGCAVVMGRRTWESIGEKPLPGRFNIVVSPSMFRLASPDIPDGIWVVPTLADAFFMAEGAGKADRCYVIGGARLIEEALPLVDELELTIIDREWEGDVLFPTDEGVVDRAAWRDESYVSGATFGPFVRTNSQHRWTQDGYLVFARWVRAERPAR